MEGPGNRARRVVFAPGRTYEPFRLAGIPIGVHPSWLIILLLLSWSLAVGWFPARVPGLDSVAYWTLGVAGALGLFVSILLHELAHALVARRHGLGIRGITLFLFGGVARMESEPPSPGLEFRVAIAGPIASVVISGVCLGASSLGRGAGLAEAPITVVDYLAVVNLIVVGFNLVPAFPLDGGRVLRSILWRWKGNLRWATRVCAGLGAYFGAFLIVLGVLSMIGGGLIGGIWFALIGLFLRQAARTGYQQLLLRQLFQGEPVRRFARSDVVTVPPDISIRRLLDDYVYRDHFKMYPVVEDDVLLGRVTTRAIKKLPREDWDTTPVRALMAPPSDDNTIGLDADALEGLQKMGRTGDSRLMVTSNGRLVGILTLKDLLELFRLKLELEEE